ncbi:carboxylesterase family protein [Chryseobacterium culicis]|uniref:carboxylesterase family protein n=1 Tax=Chryseobacterium culicis TaxID=680127 RepID=UPI00289DA01E|nr:carboxylesterase family protein [Chryseobacterium culicis]
MNKEKTGAHTVRQWLGIPYAKAERFGKPILLDFNSDLPYNQKGPAPFQPGNSSWLEADNGISEDCLNLNIWSPEDAGNELLPVIVYIFGGGFEMGSNTQTTSNLSGLAATGRAIGVSINYRLGPLGWLSLSQYGGTFSNATNLGLQDIITALKWIQKNISRFGGDPDNVTVTGHSAGGFSTAALLAAPAAEGVFRRLAPFSGGASRIIPAWWAEELAYRFLNVLGIQDEPEQLYKIDAKVLAETLIGITPRDIGDRNGIDNTTTGIVDDHLQPGAVLTGTPLESLKSGKYRDIDILFSTAKHEGDWWVINAPEKFDPGSIENLVGELVEKSRIPRSRARSIIDAYNIDGRTPLEVRGAFLTDYLYTLPAARAAIAHAGAGGKAYILNVGSVEGAHAVHGTEMYGIVGQECPGQSGEQAIRDTFVRDTLITFAEGAHDKLWDPVTSQPISYGVGNQPSDPTAYARHVLEIFKGIERP